MRPQQDTVTSSEIADWVYCQEAWRLRQIGTESANTAQRAAGTAHHSHKAFAEILAGVFIAIGRILILAALLALAALWWLSR